MQWLAQTSSLKLAGSCVCDGLGGGGRRVPRQPDPWIVGRRPCRRKQEAEACNEFITDPDWGAVSQPISPTAYPTTHLDKVRG